MKVRAASLQDLATIMDIERRAFGEEEEATLVSNLMHDATAEPSLTLIASIDGQDVGHILFTAVTLNGPNQDAVTASILAPLAVVPENHGQGVGGALIQEGLKRLKASGVDLVFVLGHPEYYPRHGFQTAGVLGLTAPYPIEDKNAAAWMVQALKPDILGSVSGVVQCAKALHRAEYWVE